MSKLPVFIPLIPPVKGKDISIPPNAIQDTASPDLLNVRFGYGQLQSRPGTFGKYAGCVEHSLLIDTLYNYDGSTQLLIALGLSTPYSQLSSQHLMYSLPVYIPVTVTGSTNSNTTVNSLSSWAAGWGIDDVIVGGIIYDDAGRIPDNTIVVAVDANTGTITLSQAATGTGSSTLHVPVRFKLTTGNTDNYSLDEGDGVYTSSVVNSGGDYPLSGYAPIMLFTNTVDGVFVVFIGDASPHSGIPICERLLDTTPPLGIDGARAVLFFDNRLIIAGTTNSASELLWSASSLFSDFVSAGSGSILIGDGIDQIQAMKRLSEFLIVYKERSIYLGQRSGLVDPAISFIPAPQAGIGLAGSQTIGDLGDAHIFLGWDNVYQLSAGGLEVIGDSIRDELFGRVGNNGIIPQYIKRCIGGIVEETAEYWLMIPSGRVPEITNLVPRPCLDFIWVENADLTNGSGIITNIDQGEISYIKIGDYAYHSSITGGGAKIIGTPVTSNTVAANSIVLNKPATATATNERMYIGGEDTWALQVDGDGNIRTEFGGNLGGIFQTIAFTTGTYVSLVNDNLIDIGVTGNQELSLLVWVKGTVSLELRIDEYDAAGVTLSESSSRVVAIDTTVFIPQAFAFTCISASCRKVQVSIINNTANSDLSIDGVQLCNITNLPLEMRYYYSDQAVPGYENGVGISPIPFITGGVGPWILDTIWVYNYVIKAWSCWRFPITGFGYDVVSSTFTIADLTGTVEEQQWRFSDKLLETLSPTNLLGGVDGQIYEISEGYSSDYFGFLNTPILTYWQSKDFDLGNPELDKTYSRLVIKHEVSHPPTAITISISTNSGIDWIDQIVAIRQGYTETFADFFVTATQGRFRIRATGPLKITGFIFKIIQRGEANAY